MMADDHIRAKVHALSDVELACLLSLTANEHCVVSTPPDCLDDLVAELELVCEATFGLTSAVVECTPSTTLDDFATSLLLQQQPSSPTTTRSLSPYLSRSAHDSYFPTTNKAPGHHHAHQIHGTYGPGYPNQPSSSSTRLQSPSSPLTPTLTLPGPSNSPIANVILAKNLDQAPKAVQIQALELLRTHRIFTRTSVQTAPKTFMLIAVLGAESGGEARVTPHLNDFFYVAHWVDPDDEGFPHLDGDDDSSLASSSYDAAHRGQGDDDAASLASTASVVKRRSRASGRLFRSPKSTYTDGPPRTPVFSSNDLSDLRQLSSRVFVDIDVTRYLMNIISFLRMHRAVAGGITPQATRHFQALVKSLAPLHGLDYVTPPLVCLAARKVYLHRIKMAEPAKERSMQWGSELTAIERLLDGWGPEDVVEEVLEMVAAPV